VVTWSRALVSGAVSAAVCTVLVLVAAWGWELPLGEAAILAPILVVSVGALGFIVVLWSKILWETLRRQRHPARIVAGAVAALAVLVVLSFFVTLPSGH
jgi:hypothetical protein